MELSKALKKIEKYFDGKIEIHQENNGGKFCKYYFCYKGKVASFLTQPYWRDSSKLEVLNFHIRQENDHSDISVDYFAGYFCDNLLQLLHAMKPPASKFEVGDLVMFKSSKRCQRKYVPGKMCLIKSEASWKRYYNLIAVENNQKIYSNVLERDIMLAKVVE